VRTCTSELLKQGIGRDGGCLYNVDTLFNEANMEVEIQKWGNSAAVRVPALVLREAGISLGQTLELTIENGRLVFAPKKEWSLEELVAAITPDNCHPLLLDDGLKGNETW
jgi:antitoxin MazE